MVKKYINYIYILVAILVLFAGVFFYIYGKKAINIAYMVDNNYVPYMITSMHSAIKNKNKESVYNFYIIAENFSSENIDKIKKIKEHNVNIEIIPARQKTLDYSHLGRFASFKIAMQKIFIPDYLENIDKVLYLDADTLIQKDLNKIYAELTDEEKNIVSHRAKALKKMLTYLKINGHIRPGKAKQHHHHDHD
jgi:lipopolysaccharide biosynthesis glycosyltransferase